jgi:hypothetical protein
MLYTQLEAKLKRLPEEYIMEVIDFVDFLQKKAELTQNKKTAVKADASNLPPITAKMVGIAAAVPENYKDLITDEIMEAHQ